MGKIQPLPESYLKGRGAQHNPHNHFLNNEYVAEHPEGLDEAIELDTSTQYFTEHPRNIVNKVNSPDVGPAYSMNPYQGCEHGCIYCYARNSHEYYGFSAGVDFERRIITKPEAPLLLEAYFKKRGYTPRSIMLAGNTDCYQPIERKLKITRSLLEVFLKYRHPVGIITKNYTVTRDIDLLQELAAMNLVTVMISVTTLNAELHQKMEPRTAAPHKRLKAIRELFNAGIPVGVMNAPIIPGLNDHEIPEVLKACSENGALGAGFTVVRLNGAIGDIFTKWIKEAYPLKADKVLHSIEACHQGKLNDSRYGKRMRGDGNRAEMIHNLFKISKARHFAGKSFPEIDYTRFRIPKEGQMELF